MKSRWVTNFKRHYYFINLNETKQIRLQVNNSGVRFNLLIVCENKDYPIACSNNMQILKDLVYAIQNGVEMERILNSFRMLQITNLHLLL